MNRNKMSQQSSKSAPGPKQVNKKGKKKVKSAVSARSGVTAPYTKGLIRRIRPDVFGSSNFRSTTDSIPAAFVNVENDPTYMKMVGPCYNKRLDLPGICLMGRQPLTTVTTAVASTDLFTATSLATLNNANSIFVSPDTLNGPLAAQANLHGLYVFRDILLSYESNVATTQPGSMSLSYLRDAAQNGTVTDFSTSRQVSPSVNFPFRADRAYLHIHYDGDELFFTELDGTSLSALRLTTQGVISGWPSVTSLGAISQGFIDIQYVIELYQPVPSQGFTVQVSASEKALVDSYLRRLREDDSSSSSAPPSLTLPSSSAEQKSGPPSVFRGKWVNL